MAEEIINFYSENEFQLSQEEQFKEWIRRVVQSEAKRIGEINYIFCDDEYLLRLNQQYLNHDTLTDIITFDNTVGNILGGDVFISTERVEENATIFGVLFVEELKRVIVHGILHLAGYNDKTENERNTMRRREEEKIEMFHVEQ